MFTKINATPSASADTTPAAIPLAINTGGTLYVGMRVALAHVGQRAPTGVCTIQAGQINSSHRLHLRLVSFLGFLGQ